MDDREAALQALCELAASINCTLLPYVTDQVQRERIEDAIAAIREIAPVDFFPTSPFH